MRSAGMVLWHGTARLAESASSPQPGTRRPLGPGPCTRLTCSASPWAAAAAAAGAAGAAGVALGAEGEEGAGEGHHPGGADRVRYRGEGVAHRCSLAAVG